MVLFVGISFLVVFLQKLLPQELIGRTLSGSRRGLGNVLGAAFGALTPFCSCSTIPILVGLLNSGVPFGASMSFLIASPILNPAIIGLLLMLFGLEFTLVYFALAFASAVVTGALWERLGLARDVKRVRIVKENCCASETSDFSPGLQNAVQKAKEALLQATGLFLQVLPYLLVGALIGAFIYGWVPEELIVRLAGRSNALAVPIAAAIGVPMYIRAETMIPISSVLIKKGMSLGAVTALIIGGAGASIPEVLLLNAVFKRRLLIAFVVTVFLTATVTGYVVNLIV